MLLEMLTLLGAAPDFVVFGAGSSPNLSEKQKTQDIAAPILIGRGGRGCHLLVACVCVCTNGQDVIMSGRAAAYSSPQ